ncbi:uncharacterized protein V6R79_000971 [Siganus canaliculatus]
MGVWGFLLVLLSLVLAGAHNHREETETYLVSAGHLFVLSCYTADTHTNVTWIRGSKEHNHVLPAGVEVRDGLLWFLPVQASHEGLYTCQKKVTGLTMTFKVKVSSGECPETPETVSKNVGASHLLPCKQKEIFRLSGTRQIRWMKDCHPLEGQAQTISVYENGDIRLPVVSEKDAGTYTCVVDINLDGRNYTAARSIQLTVDEDPPPQSPEIVFPQDEVRIVKVGTRVDLECSAHLGYSEDSETSMYWNIDLTHSDDHEGVNYTWKYTHERDSVYGLSILSISEVPRHFLNIPIHCIVENPTGQAIGSVCLREADHSELHTSVALCLTASLTLLALALAFLYFKEHVVLASRKLLRHFTKQKPPDGKLYDAYVSIHHSSIPSSTEMDTFALQMLPEKLEKQHGYSLYIRGRDDCPGEAVHDAIAATVQQCRRLIIILSPEAAKRPTEGNKEKEELLCENQNQLWYEQKIGLYDALTQNDPRVILVEINGPVDYSCLPESLRYLKRKQGSLKWREPPAGSHQLTTWSLNKNFWIKLRYHMPSVPAGLLTLLSSVTAEKIKGHVEEERPHSDKSKTAINTIYREMDTIQLLILIIAMTPSACSEASMLQCTPLDTEFFNIYKGEAFYFVPYDLDDANQTDEEITWYKNSSPNEPISTNENDTVHYHGGALFFLNVSTENSGSYTARHVLSPDSCFTYHVNIKAFDKQSDEALLYGSIDNSNQNKMMPCPDPVSYTCQEFNGELTWKKDFELLHGHSNQRLWVNNASKDDEGIYTCTCYWTHNNQVYESSASRRLILKGAYQNGTSQMKNSTVMVGPSESILSQLFVQWSLHKVPVERL